VEQRLFVLSVVRSTWTNVMTGSTEDASATDLGSALHDRHLNRREFLASLNALAVLALLDGCKPKSSSDAVDGDRYAQVLALLREAVQASPDYLQAGAVAAVRSKDVAVIERFVRERISVIPSWNQGDDPTSARRWGTAGTLRGGAGMLRDRADLLGELLGEAGFTAKVMAAKLPASIDLSTLYQPRAADFTPDQKLIDRAAALLPSAALPKRTRDLVDPAQITAVTQALTAAIPEAILRAAIRNDLMPDSVPVVVVGRDKPMYLFALGSLTPTSTTPAGLMNAPFPGPTPNVQITVEGLTNPAPGSTTKRGEIVTLVSGTFTAEQVFGRQVLLNFVPAAGVNGYLDTSPEEQPVRVPLLTVQTELPAYAAAAPTSHPVANTILQVAGSPITLQGDVLTQTTDGGDAAQLGAYGKLVALGAPQRAAARTRVGVVRVRPRASTFPEVELDVTVLDRSGQPVDGLAAADFIITENGRSASVVQLQANSAVSSRPRVLVCYDTTGSVAENWPSVGAKGQFEVSLAETLADTAARIPFDVQVAAACARERSRSAPERLRKRVRRVGSCFGGRPRPRCIADDHGQRLPECERGCRDDHSGTTPARCGWRSRRVYADRQTR